MYYLKKSAAAMPIRKQNLELFQLLELARHRISGLKTSPDIDCGELEQWERLRKMRESN